MSGEPVERKVDSEAEGTPGNARIEPDDLPEAEGSRIMSEGSAVGGLLTDLSVGSIPSLTLAVLLFGGFLVAFYGLARLVQNYLGTHAALLVIGLSSMGLAYLLAQVYARRGWI